MERPNKAFSITWTNTSVQNVPCLVKYTPFFPFKTQLNHYLLSELSLLFCSCNFSPIKYSIPLYLTSKHALLFTVLCTCLIFQWDYEPFKDRDGRSFPAALSSIQHSTLHTVDIWYLSPHDQIKLPRHEIQSLLWLCSCDFPNLISHQKFHL